MPHTEQALKLNAYWAAVAIVDASRMRMSPKEAHELYMLRAGIAELESQDISSEERTKWILSSLDGILERDPRGDLSPFHTAKVYSLLPHLGLSDEHLVEVAENWGRYIEGLSSPTDQIHTNSYRRRALEVISERRSALTDSTE